MGSTRLPGKILMPLGTSTVLDYVVDRCRQDSRISDVIVATSVLPQDDPIRNWCAERDVTCFSGSEDDVLSRYYECALPYRPDYVIRVTSDCPFIDHAVIGRIIDSMESHPSDLVRLEGGEPVRGFWSEIFSLEALSLIHRIGQEPRHREHVTYYAYEYPERFRSRMFPMPSYMRHPELRITLDTPEDYAMLQTVADHFKGDRLVSSEAVVEYLLAHPEVASINAHITQKPVV